MSAMMSAVKAQQIKVQQWFNRFNRREQLMLLLCAALVIIYGFYWLIWTPLIDSRENLQLQNRTAAQSLQSVRKLASQYKALGGTAQPVKQRSGGSLSQIVDSTVAGNQLRMKRFQPSSSGDAQVRFEEANFNHIVAWLHEIESQYGLIVKDLSVTPGNNGGYVNVSVRLSQSG